MDSDPSLLWVWFALLWFFSFFTTLRLSDECGQPIFALWLGLVFGPLGPVLILLLPRSAKRQAAYLLEVERWTEQLRASRAGNAEKARPARHP